MPDTQTQPKTQRAASNTVISDIGRLISSNLDIDQILVRATQSITAHLHHANVALLLVDPAEPQTLVLRARSGIYVDHVLGEYRQSIHQGIIGAAARTRQHILLPDVTHDPRYISIPGAPDIRAELALPMVIDDELIGVLNLESSRSFAPEEVADLQLIVHQLGVAIVSARRYREMQLLYETSQRISIATDVADVVRAYLEQVAVRGRYACNVALYEFDATAQRTAVLVHGRWTPADGLQCPLLLRMPYTHDALDPPLDAGETVRISNVLTDPRISPALQAIQKGSGRPALAMIPLLVRGVRIGLVILSYPAVHEWLDAELHPYQITAAQLATAIDSRRQQARVAHHDQQLAVLEERRRLAAELHDSVTQLIFSTTLIAQSVGPAWRRDPAQGEQRIQRLLELSRAALAEMRTLLRELRPPTAADAASPTHGTPPGNFVAALRQYAARVDQTGLHLVFDAPEQQSFPAHVEDTLYRIAQEALNNVVKHARAKRVWISLHCDDHAVYLTVRDDGVGFEPNGATPMSHAAPRSIGLQTMRERAEAAGGVLLLESAPQCGATVSVTLPIPAAELHTQ